MPLLQVDNFLELAQVMKKSKFLLANSSFCWNLNRALNLPSILEVFRFAPSCQTFVGNKNYGFFHQNALRFYFDELLNESKK